MLHAIPNHSADSAVACEPWSIVPDIPEEAGAAKKDFRSWSKHPATRHCFFSGFEGLQGSMRVNKKNEARFCHAIIADYDTTIDDELLKSILDRSHSEFLPNWVTKTFSGGARLIWLLEGPLMLAGNQLAAEFLKQALKELKPENLLPGLDKPAFRSCIKYYELGSEWTRLSEDPIPEKFAWLWVAEAGKRLRWASDEEIRIPLEAVEVQIEKEFPGGWHGPFEVGRRTKRFWDTSAQDDTAAVLREGGFQCFTGDDPFVNWRQLLGNAFVDGYEADKLGRVLRDTFYDGRKFWAKQDDGKWLDESTEVFRCALRTDFGLDPKPPKGGTCSEVDRAIREVQRNRRVKSAMPFVHMSKGLIKVDGEFHLNTCSINCMEPAADGGEWGENFSWLAKLLDEMYGEDQLPHLMAWWKRFYQGGLERKPVLGQAIFTVGPVGCGKTLFQCNILAKAVGGHMDSTDFIVEGNQFSGAFVQKPIMSIDDSSPASDARRHSQYSARIKKIVANPHQYYNEKYASAGQITWLGRVMVSLNEDPESLRMLPDLQQSLMDKIMIFKVKRPSFPFPESYEVDRIVDEELPHLLRWLLDWDIPEVLKGASRFGVMSYHHPSLHRQALESGHQYAFVEVLDLFLEDFHVAEPTTEGWTGTAADLLSQMKLNERIAPICGEYTPGKIGHALRKLSSQGYSVKRKMGKRTNIGNLWEVKFDLLPPEEDEKEDGK